MQLIVETPVPVDQHAHRCSNGTTLYTFWINTTGEFQEITLPPDIQCKTVKINVHDGIETFAHGPVEFHISSSNTGDGWDYWQGGAIFSIANKGTDPICYIRAESGNKIAVTILN